MKKIAILDDNELHRKQAKKLIQSYIKEQMIDVSVVTYSDSASLIQDIEDKKLITVVFLDIELEGESGIDVAKKINRTAEDIQIVFLSGHLHYATDVFDTKVCYFVLKEELEQRIPDVFHKIFKEKSNETITIKQRGKVVVLRQCDIRVIERKLRKSIIHFGDEEEAIIPDKINEVMAGLNANDFVRCHNSYIVNLNYVKEYKRQSIILSDDREVPVSRSYNKEVKERFLQWAKNYL